MERRGHRAETKKTERFVVTFEEALHERNRLKHLVYGQYPDLKLCVFHQEVANDQYKLFVYVEKPQDIEAVKGIADKFLPGIMVEITQDTTNGEAGLHSARELVPGRTTRAIDTASVQIINGRRVLSVPAIIRGFSARRKS